MAASSGLGLRNARGLGYNLLTWRFRLHHFLGVGYLLAMQRAPAGPDTRPEAPTAAP